MFADTTCARLCGARLFFFFASSREDLLTHTGRPMATLFVPRPSAGCLLADAVSCTPIAPLKTSSKYVNA